MLKPDASEEMLLATLTHDMERAFPGPDSPIIDPKLGVDNPVYNMAHSERSARIVSAYLQEQGASQESIEQVARFIRVHEYGVMMMRTLCRQLTVSASLKSTLIAS